MADIYFASASAGSNNGTSCANAFAYSDVTNGINVIGNHVAGNILHLCGTITIANNTNFFTAAASGSAGNPITLKWENGAVLTSCYWPGSTSGTVVVGAVVINNFTNWVVDGGAM